MILLISLIMPETLFAQSAQGPDPGPEWNIKIEFRYTKGQESKLNIPNSITMYGRNYHLISKTDPVLEKKLPATRTYTWLIDGVVTEADKHLVEGIDNVELTPANVGVGRVVDRHETIDKLPTNDVEAIPTAKTYPDGEFARAAVRFDIEAYDAFDLPVTYTAEVVYRGIEIFIGTGYEVKASYTTMEDLDGVPQYVIVATYAPDGLVPLSETGGTSGQGGESESAALITESEAIEPPIDQAAASIEDDSIPLAAGEGSAARDFNPILMVLIIIAAVLGGFVLWALLTRRNSKRKKMILREERRMAVLRSRGLADYDV